MKRLSFSIDINRPLANVYGLARQVERHPEFLPEYLSCRVLKRGDRLLLERAAVVKGKKRTWQSWLSFDENAALRFVHEGGRLHGMQVTWRFEALNGAGTRMTITQDFHVGAFFPWFGRFLEDRIFAPQLTEIAQKVTRSFKRACETQEEAFI